MSDLLDFREIADQCSVSYDTIRRTIRKIGPDLSIEVKRKRNKKGTLSDCLSIEDANKLKSHFESKKASKNHVQQEYTLQRFGYFYVIQLVPEALPDRVKLGYTDNIEQRLNEHQTSAPTANIIGHWRCKRYWEQAAMDSITRKDCHLVMNEVYEGDIEGFLSRAKEFFDIMPNKSGKPELSKYSPLKKKHKKL